MKQQGAPKAKSGKYLVNNIIQLHMNYIIECSLDLGNRGLVLLVSAPHNPISRLKTLLTSFNSTSIYDAPFS